MHPYYGGFAHSGVFGNEWAWWYRDEIARAVAKAVNGEYNAVRKYGRLMELAPNEDFRKLLENIRSDEQEHFKLYSEWYGRLTGGKTAPVTDEPLPTVFIDGVEASLRDELEDAKFYRDLSSASDDPALKQAALYTALDEQRHASWFMYIWEKVK